MLTKTKFHELREDTEKALEEVGKKYGINITAGNITYSDNKFSLKLDCVKTGVDVEKEEFMRNVAYFREMTPNDYLRVIKLNKVDYQLIGFKVGCKYNVLMRRRKDNRIFAFTYEAVLAAIEEANP